MTERSEGMTKAARFMTECTERSEDMTREDMTREDMTREDMTKAAQP